jgi:hypothetical protein
LNVYYEVIGDTPIEVVRRGSYYDLLIGGVNQGSFHGRKRATEAVKSARITLYAAIEKLPTPPSIRSDIGKLLASIIASDFETKFGFPIQDLPRKEPELRQFYVEAAQKECAQRAVFGAACYAVHAIKTRQPMPDDVKAYYQQLTPADKWKLPRGWRNYYEKLQKYAATTAKNMATEGGVNAAWSK